LTIVIMTSITAFTWWRDHFASSGALDVAVAQEVTDGDIMWEDDVLYRGDRSGWSPAFLDRSAWLIRHVLAGRSAPSSLTHCMVVATKRSGPQPTPAPQERGAAVSKTTSAGRYPNEVELR
jgi:hypothetical protein